MTSIPKHRIIGLVAAVALCFWLGLTITILQGTEKLSDEDGFTVEVTISSPERPRAVSATELYYKLSHTEALPEEINSLEFYFRRLPTPDEYVQIKAIVQKLPSTNFSIYKPCRNGENEGFVMQLSHFLEQEAVFDTPLREGEVLQDYFVFALRKRTVATTSIPDNLPLRSFGYYRPTITNTHSSGTEAIANYQIRYSQQPEVAEKLHFTTAKQASIGTDDIAIFINGERYHLLPKPDIKRENGFYYAGIADKDIWYGIEESSSASHNYPAELAKLDARFLRFPPNAWMACLLGMEDDLEGMVRNVSERRNLMQDSPTKFLKSFLDVQERYNSEFLLYLNDEPITREDLLEIDIPKEFYLHTGYNKNKPDQPEIVQIITNGR